MKIWKNKEWHHKTTGVDGNTILFDVNIFDYKWKSTKESIEVLDPIYKQKHTADIYTVIINDKEYIFAATEFSNCVWGFYTFDY